MAEQRVSSASPFEAKIGFSRAVCVGSIIAVSGTAPIGPDGKTVGQGDAAAQMRRCIEIVRDALEQLGASLEDVIRTRTMLTNIADWESVGLVHGEYFSQVRPASTMLQVARLIDPDWLVEFEADAVVKASGLL